MACQETQAFHAASDGRAYQPTRAYGFGTAGTPTGGNCGDSHPNSGDLLVDGDPAVRFSPLQNISQIEYGTGARS
jgi:hypothetical protein